MADNDNVVYSDNYSAACAQQINLKGGISAVTTALVTRTRC